MAYAPHANTAWNAALSDNALAKHIGHIKDKIQARIINDDPILNSFYRPRLEKYTARFQVPANQVNIVNGLPGAQGEQMKMVATFSHVYCPFIWHVLTWARNWYPQKNIPDIPSDWLTYGHNSVGLAREVPAALSPSGRAIPNRYYYANSNTPAFYTGENEPFWKEVSAIAASDEAFVDYLLSNLLPEGVAANRNASAMSSAARRGEVGAGAGLAAAGAGVRNLVENAVNILLRNNPQYSRELARQVILSIQAENAGTGARGGRRRIRKTRRHRKSKKHTRKH